MWDAVIALVALPSVVCGGWIGFARQWRRAWLGIAAGGVVLAASTLAGNDSVSGNSDLSWKALLVGAGIAVPALFYGALVAAGLFSVVTGRTGRSTPRGGRIGARHFR
jgi:hypothetical protein